MRQFFVCALLAGALLSCNQQKSAEEPAVKNTSVSSTDSKASSADKPQSEFADAKYADIGRKMMSDFEGGNMDAYMTNFADNAVYQWSSGDSLAGKKAIADYWTNRFKDIIETIDLSNDIWLPVQVNTPQKGPDVPGVWLLGWHQVNVKYKKAVKPLQFWIHTDYHFDSNNKIDRVVQYMDRAPINAALGGK
jgi:hypothetical protein